MKPHHEELHRQLYVLRDNFSALSHRLQQASQELEAFGVPPTDELIAALSVSRQQFADLRDGILELAASSPLKSDETASLKSLEALLQAAAEIEKKKFSMEESRRRALEVLEQVLRIVHRDHIDFPPLLECQAKARALHQDVSNLQWPDSHADLESLAEQKHPLAELLLFVEKGEELDNEQWEFLQEAVVRSFGKSLSVAASRRKLIISSELIERKTDLVAETKLHDITATQQASPETKSEDNNKFVPQESIFEEQIGEIKIITESPQTSEKHEPAAETLVAESPSPKSLDEAHPQEPAKEELATESPLQKNEMRDEAYLQEPAEEVLVAESPSQRPERIDETFSEPVEEVPSKPLCYFSVDDTAQKIAASILNTQNENRTESLRDLVWRLILDDRFGLAYHVNNCLENLYPDLHPRLPSWLIRAAALSGHLCHENDKIAPLLKDDFNKFNNGCFSTEHAVEWNQAVRFLLIAATLRPALLAPITGATAILHTLIREGLKQQLFEYCQIIAKNNQALEAVTIKQVRSQAAWQAELKVLQDEAEKWFLQAPQKSMEFAHATFVWQQWQKPGGVVHSLLLYIKQNDSKKVPAAKKEVDRWSDEREIRDTVNYTDRKVLGRRRGADITSDAFKQICRHLREAVRLVRRWIDLQAARPGQAQNFSQARAEQMRQQLWARHEAVIRELDHVLQSHPPLFIHSGNICCRCAVENIRLLFDPEVQLPDEEPEPRYLLHADLLKTSLPMNEQWEPEDNSNEIIDQILHLLTQDHFDWRQAFYTHSEWRDHEGTKRIIEYLEKNTDKRINLNELRDAREKNLRECQAALQRDVEETRKHIESAVALGLLGEIKRGGYTAELDAIIDNLPKTLRFYEKRIHLQNIRAELLARRKDEVENARQRLKDPQLSPEQPIYNRICSALDKGDVFTANEYIDIVRAGQTIPESTDDRDPFSDFFPEKAREIDYFLEKETPSPQAVIRRVQAREFIAGIDLQRVTDAQSDSAAEMLEAWYTAKKAKAIYDTSARQVLTHLGFSVLRLNIDRSRARVWINVVTEPICDRERCPVALYGSSAYGNYRVLCVWSRPSEEDLLNEVGDTSHNNPVLVFYFGRMSEKQRRDLARLCRERRRTFIVLDETLLIYLCGERGSRLPVLFKCALPFTFLEPYTTTASLVPPEMFYGRERERDSIINPMGSCFIYGGRQLGKTALQRDVARKFHQPHQGHLALWLDLKSEEIGYKRPSDSIWDLLARELKKLQVLPEKLRSNTGVDRLLELIQNWLDENKQRRILILLDEADKFLDSDGKEKFACSARLKGLMDKTERRFKVVFAGLHNVQRTTKQSNHPLAHYGTPLCIGPLLENGEARKARALIEYPLASLGYRFESSDLAILILSQTNYYPSLIQLYCDQLLRHLSDSHIARFDPKNSPPFIITSKHVEEAYRSKELRDSIRQRFNLTLQLDQRYEVIAYFIAYYCRLEDRKGMVEGFDWSWIRDQALTWWPKVFAIPLKNPCSPCWMKWWV